MSSSGSSSSSSRIPYTSTTTGTGNEPPPPPPLRRLTKTSNNNNGSTRQVSVGRSLNLNGTASTSLDSGNSKDTAHTASSSQAGSHTVADAGRSGGSHTRTSSVNTVPDASRSGNRHTRTSSSSTDNVSASHRTTSSPDKVTPSHRSQPSASTSTSSPIVLPPSQRSQPSSSNTPAAHRSQPSTSSSNTPSAHRSQPSTSQTLRMKQLQEQQQQQQQQKQPIQDIFPSDTTTTPVSRDTRFQPRGTTRSRYSDFLDARKNRKTDQEGLRNTERILKRVEKLAAIHDPLSAPTSSRTSSPAQGSSSSLLSTLAPHSRFLTTLRNTSTIRSLEQELVPWQPDQLALQCPICTHPFKLGRRKHHCRACGRVVCGSNDNNDNSWCSTSVIRDKQGNIQDVPSETQSLEAILTSNSQQQQQQQQQPPSLQSSFRLCLSCRQIILKSQYIRTDTDELPAYLKLYTQLMGVQKQIEETLPEFQELIMSLSKQDAQDKKTLQLLQKDAMMARKQLLTNFAEYDSIARRFVGIDSNGNTSLKRIQEGIARRATFFLQAYMFPLQSLPTSTKKSAAEPSTPSNQPSKETLETIQVLQEQRNQIASFLARAQKERKLNDLPLLQRNLNELDQEIQKLSVSTQ
ncbi:unnamed protein product [Sympodiomycopsis kandeliae]